jgi:mono/diheme cytochrome c family protein
MTFVAAALFGLASLGSGASVSAADLTEEMVRKIAEEVAERVAREVAAEVAKQAAIEAVEEYNEDNAGEHTELEFTEEFLADPERIAAGKEIWDEQCALCHGARAYPGKAPKPKRYTPNFVYDRITNGFRKMPAWKDVYDDEERMDLVAWIKSRKFSP